MTSRETQVWGVVKGQNEIWESLGNGILALGVGFTDSETIQNANRIGI